MTAERTYRVTILHYPSGRWLEDINIVRRPTRGKVEALPRLQVPGSYEICLSRVAGGELAGQEYSYTRHVGGICWHAGEPDPYPRRCFYIDVVPYDSHGYVPSIVVEGEPGHKPLTGNGTFARPWYWGTTYAKAKAVCERENMKMFDLSPAEALAIVMSSMSLGTLKVTS